MTEHTPGPWRVGEEIKSSKRLVYIRIEYDGGESSLSNTCVYPHRKDGSTYSTETRNEFGEDRPEPAVEDEECRANARLIAAAPDLLAACLRILADGYGTALGDLEFMQRAVDKAVGK